jgi:hypothetical protein
LVWRSFHLVKKKSFELSFPAAFACDLGSANQPKTWNWKLVATEESTRERGAAGMNAGLPEAAKAEPGHSILKPRASRWTGCLAHSGRSGGSCSTELQNNFTNAHEDMSLEPGSQGILSVCNKYPAIKICVCVCVCVSVHVCE